MPALPRPAEASAPPPDTSGYFAPVEEQYQTGGGAYLPGYYASEYAPPPPPPHNADPDYGRLGPVGEDTSMYYAPVESRYQPGGASYAPQQNPVPVVPSEVYGGPSGYRPHGTHASGVQTTYPASGRSPTYRNFGEEVTTDPVPPLARGDRLPEYSYLIGPPYAEQGNLLQVMDYGMRNGASRFAGNRSPVRVRRPRGLPLPFEIPFFPDIASPPPEVPPMRRSATDSYFRETNERRLKGLFGGGD